MYDGLNAFENEDGEAHNLLGALVQALQAEEHGLSDDELYGNLFIYNMAGHETTTNTVATSIAYLAAAPQWQDWICEELRAVLGKSSSVGEWDYADVYPQLRRCQAVQLETLRLHGSTVFLPKAIGSIAQVVTIKKTEYVIPPKTFVLANSQALHCDPQIWGADALHCRLNGRMGGSSNLVFLERKSSSILGQAPLLAELEAQGSVLAKSSLRSNSRQS
ncbi:MAG: hypothetical protein Q9165_004761 [Trypethelium subeluteriae]